MTFGTFYAFAGIIIGNTDFLVASSTVKFDYISYMPLILTLRLYDAYRLAAFGALNGFSTIVLRNADFLSTTGTA